MKMTKDLSVREFRQKHPMKYNMIFKYAVDNWQDLISNTIKFNNTISVADQIELNTGCSTGVALEIANSISVSMATL